MPNILHRFVTSLAYGFVRSVVTNPLIAFLVPWLVAFYLGFLDYFSDLSWIKDYQGIHIAIYMVTLVLLGIVQALRAWLMIVKLEN